MKSSLKQVETVEIQDENAFGVRIIKREDLPRLETIKVGESDHSLGLVQEFRKHDYLRDFMPQHGRCSISWAHIGKEKILEPHTHPTNGLVIVAEGEGLLLGEINDVLRPGDIVATTAGHAHGFTGTSEGGFWALTIQFEGLGLYEDIENPRIKFVEKHGKTSRIASKKRESETDVVTLLEKDQVTYQKRFNKGALMKLIRSKKVEDRDVQNRLLEALNFWSNWFQRILAARVAAGNPGIFQEMAEHHFAEEIGHNHTLLKMRSNTPVAMWDPILDATSSWFYQRVVSGSAEERTILMHCVLEAASCIFHSSAQSIFPKADHFSLHSELDQGHAQEGFDILRKITISNIENLRKILGEGWRMAEHLTGSMARYALRG